VFDPLRRENSFYIENSATENISSRKRSRFPPFEKRKGWGTLSCDDIGTERMGHQPDTERDCGTIPDTILRSCACHQY
jgi:hypothetical protein